MRPPPTADEAGVLVVTLDDPGLLNDGRSDAYRLALYQLVESRPQPLVAADLSPIDYLSSTGLTALVGLKKRVDAVRGKLVLFGVHPHVVDVLRVTRLDRYFTVAPDRAAALARLGVPPAS